MQIFRMMKVIIILILIMTALPSFSQMITYDFEKLDSLQKVEKRNVMVFIHADWCKYCKAMMQTTFKNKSIQQTLKDQFYFVQLNAEERKTILFNGRAFSYLPTGNKTGSNSLALELANINGEVNYPTITFLNPKNEIIFQHSGFVNGNDLSSFLEHLKLASE